MESWDDLRYLVAVHRAGTMSGAARALGTSVATVSRRLEKLSQILGVPLLVKTAAGWHTNPDVAHLIDVASTFDQQVATALNHHAAGTANEAPRPVSIRMCCPPLLNSLILTPRLNALRDVSPQVQLSVRHASHPEALGDSDLMVSTALPRRGRLRSRRFGALEFGIYRHRDTPSPGTAWIGFMSDHDESDIMRMCRQHFGGPPAVRLESQLFVADAMLSTGLPGPLPLALAAREPRFVPLATGDEAARVDFWICYHDSRRGDPVLRTVVDWVTDSFREEMQSTQPFAPWSPAAIPPAAS